MGGNATSPPLDFSGFFPLVIFTPYPFDLGFCRLGVLRGVVVCFIHIIHLFVCYAFCVCLVTIFGLCCRLG